MKMSHPIKFNPLAALMAMIIAATPVYSGLNTDYDGDGLTYSEENALGTDNFNPDTDGGGAQDGWEVKTGFDPLDGSDDVNVPPDLDIDNDGIGNPEEGTVINDIDSDNDGLTDTFEAGLPDENHDGIIDDLSDTNLNGMADIAESLAVSGEYPDFDGDGTPDYLDADSDNDEVPDYLEYKLYGLPMVKIIFGLAWHYQMIFLVKMVS